MSFGEKIIRNNSLQAKRLVVVSYQTGHFAYKIYKGKENR